MSRAGRGKSLSCAGCMFVLLAVYTFALAENPTVSYRQQIRPILAANCFKCHGPDPTSREADLRLDEREAAIADRGGYAAIAPGDADASEVWKRIVADDPDVVMPPPGSNKTLSAEQKELLGRWIREGAKYEAHWAFQPSEKPPIPEVNNPAWIHNDIDRFVLSELEKNGLRPSPRANRDQLVRRMYLDLIGLPPTPAETDEFVLDRRPDAYERLVDRLLSSPHYGERWARRWLDLARYSDTNGYEKDRPRSMWMYRDWVIQALNNDMPFDQFTIEQLAGDLLPNPTREQQIATGFHRNTMINEEGGVDPQEMRFNSIVDRVATTGTAWLGLTMGCAQCHTHKFDPLTHQEYYAIFALFNNADEVELLVDTPHIVSRRAEVEKQIAALTAELPDRFAAVAGSSQGGGSESGEFPGKQQFLQRAFHKWQAEVAEQLAIWHMVAPTHMKTNLATLTQLDDQSVLASGDVTKTDVYDLQFDLGATTVSAVRIEAIADESLPGGGPGRQSIASDGASSEGDFFLSEMTVVVVDGPSGDERTLRTVAFESARESYSTPGMSAAATFDGRGDTGWRIMGREGEWHAAVFVFREPVTLAQGERLRFRLVHESFYPAGLGRFRFSFSGETGVLPFALYPQAIARAIQTAEERRSPAANDQLLEYFLLQTPELTEEQQRIADLRKQLPRPVRALAVKERTTNPRITRRHVRGEYLNTAECAAPRVPDCLPQLPAAAPPDRLTFARWLVAADNPLTARVAVNRQWQAFFGRGLVQTIEDFGVQGEFPTHPQLLDYLANTFVEQGWSVKCLHKLIVMSATYQQSATLTPELMERDPENRLLGRASRFRLDAELVRDAVLQASGLLSPRIGGPSVFPDQPAGVTESAFEPMKWKVSAGDERFRRGLYTFNKRTAPYAAFGLYDAPSGETCCPRRTNSNTPLQSLELLNDPVVIEASRSLARLSIKESDGEHSRIATEMFRRCVTRSPSPQELDAICRFQADQEARFLAGDADAKLIAGDSGQEYDSPVGSESPSYAAWVLTARAIINLDETITRQ